MNAQRDAHSNAGALLAKIFLVRRNASYLSGAAWRLCLGNACAEGIGSPSFAFTGAFVSCLNKVFTFFCLLNNVDYVLAVQYFVLSIFV